MLPRRYCDGALSRYIINNMNDKFLEQFYESVILSRYKDGIDIGGIKWKDHGKVELDSWAHYFEDKNGKEYVLLFEDSPGSSFLDDGLSHEVIKLGDESSIGISFSDGKYIPNVTGYFTLYREK